MLNPFTLVEGYKNLKEFLTTYRVMLIQPKVEDHLQPNALDVTGKRLLYVRIARIYRVDGSTPSSCNFVAKRSARC